MTNVLARVAAAGTLVLIALAVSSVMSVSAKDPDNPNGSHDGLINNPGHHYGQLKHIQPPPAPDPQPAPAPDAQPGTAPGTHGSGATTGNTVHTGISLSISDFSVPAGQGLHSAVRLDRAASWEAEGGLDWLILLVLPLLLAVWIIVAARMVDHAMRAGRGARARVARAYGT